MSPVPLYEARPKNPLPLLNLSRSFGGELFGFVHALVGSHTTRVHPIQNLLQDPDAPVERITRYRIALMAYGFSNVIGGIACFIPHFPSRVLAIVALILALPFSLTNMAYLRYDMLKLTFTTYDFWFYGLYNTLGTSLIAYSFGDIRACIAVLVWIGNLHSVLIDANTRFICYLIVVSICVVALNMLVLLAIETNANDAWQSQSFQLRHGHTDVVMTNNLISNTLLTMSIIVARNAYRRRQELIQQAKIGCPMLRCLNYRIRLKITMVDAARIAQLEAMTPVERIYYAPNHAQPYPLSQMHCIRAVGLVNGSDTIYPVQLDPLVWSVVYRTGYVGLGGAGLLLTAASLMVYPSPLVQPLAIGGLICTMAFVGFTIGLFHRIVCRAIALTFDYAFLSLQLSSGLGCAAILFAWDARCIALASIWLWLHWVITIDALSLFMRAKIGININYFIVPVLVFFLAGQVAIAVETVWTNRWAFSDRVLVSLLGRIHIRLIPCFLSRLLLTFFWSLRLLWRVLTSDCDDAVVQLGRVAYRYTTSPACRPPKTSPSKDTATHKAPSSTFAQVAPTTFS